MRCDAEKIRMRDSAHDVLCVRFFFNLYHWGSRNYFLVGVLRKGKLYPLCELKKMFQVLITGIVRGVGSTPRYVHSFCVGESVVLFSSRIRKRRAHLELIRKDLTTDFEKCLFRQELCSEGNILKVYLGTFKRVSLNTRNSVFGNELFTLSIFF